MKKLIPALLCLALSLRAFAQQPGVTRLQVPLAGTVVLRDVKDPYNAQVTHLEAPKPDGEDEAGELAALKAQSARLFPYKHNETPLTGAKTTSVQQPAVVTAFVADSFPGIPPDNDLAVNRRSQAVNVLNSNIAVLNSVTGQMTYRKTLMSFSQAVGLNNSIGVSVHYRYDPKVFYDPEADRFICVMLNSTNEFNYIIFGFSQTADPTGAWNFYKMYGDYGADSTWFDYPAIAMTKNEFFLTGNKLVYNGSFQTGFVRSVIYQIRKSDGYNGAPLTSQIWDQVNYGGKPIRNLFPVKGGSGLKGPGQYFVNVRNVAIQNDTVFLIHIPDTIGAAGNALNVKAITSNIPYGIPPDGRQPDTVDRLQTNDGRVLGAFMEGGEIQFVSATVHPVHGGSAIYHGRITNYTTNPTVQASYITVDTMDFGYPNLSYAGTQGGQVTSIISFDYTGPKVYPGLGAVFYDGIGYSDLLQVKTGSSFLHKYFTGPQRWGDYTGSQPAWDFPGSVWIVGIYGRANHDYGNWAARLRSPYATAVPETGVPTTKASLYPNPSFSYVRIAFELEKEQQVHFAIWNTAGQLVDAVLDAACHEGKNELQFNTGTLAAGNYILKATDADGQTLFTKTFTRH